ncbi:hypothetical protein Vadar_011162 [Vaccinium darrowii]|uniref:Uncharacterized protein n=1 Tax=Vaccinium darrowii TaxID=229202 RepID=A0ACB7XQ76_9ERIC|nr:hypothetical protein Vadar_011162 [Vaccinium darrowii]
MSRKRKKFVGDVTVDMKSKVELGSNDVVGTTPPSKKKSKPHSGSTVDLKKVSGQSSAKKGSKTERGEAMKAIKKPRKSEATSETPFRSSLGGVITLVKELKLRDCHTKVLKRTPFWGIFEAVMENKFTIPQCRKSDKLIIEIIETYDPTKDKFRLGKTYMEVTREDMERVFGVKCGNEFVSLRAGCKESIKFVTRRGITEAKWTTKSVKQLLEQYVKSDEQGYIEDVARLLCVFLCHTFFFPTGTTVKWVHLQRVEDLDRMGEYDWTGAIVKDLMTSVRKHHREPRKVTGCVVALLYWLAEHTNLTEALHPEHPIGIVKWSLPTLASKFKKLWLKDLKRKQVVQVLAEVAETRESTEPEIKEVVEDICRTGDVREQNQSDKPCADDALHCNEEMPSPSNGKVNTEGRESDSSEHLDEIPSRYDGCFGLEYNDEGSTQKPPAEDEDARTIMDLRAYIASLEKELKERDESHAMEIAMVKREMKERDESHAMEVQQKDKEICSMTEKILSLLAQNNQMWDEIAENVVHEVTQSTKPMTKDKQRSLVTHLKRKHKRGTEKEEFVYPDKQKRPDQVKFGEGLSSEEVINADTYVEKPESKPEEIKGLKKNLVYRVMSNEDKDKIDRIWKEVTCSTSIWCGTIVRCSIFVEDLRCLIIETALHGNKLIVGKTHEEREDILGRMMRNTSNYRYLFFPIHNHFHWTLLVHDTEEGSWRFYNSLRPRTGVDHNLESAKILKIAVDNYFKGNSGGLFCTQDCQPIQQEEAPQQVAGSLDCGVIVCYIIRQYFRNEIVETKLPKLECRKLRAEIIHAFINDEANSWKPEHNLEDVGHESNQKMEQAVGVVEAGKKQAAKRKRK